MARILLVFGNPGNGKSTLANRLKTEHGFEVVSVDDAYVQWVESRCQSLYFEALDKFIAQHYHSILAGDYSKGVFGRDLIAEWHSYLLALIIECSQKHDSLVVEGYLLFDCKDTYERQLTKHRAQVFQIHAENHLYSTTARLSIEEIASLGAPTTKRAL